MFGRWLALMRRGPDLLRAGSLGADPDAVRPGQDHAPPPRISGRPSSRDAEGQSRRSRTAEEGGPPIYDS